MTIGRRIVIFATAVAGISLGYATPANAQATRTWVSGVGDDVNPCSRTAPCKTFAGAISKTAAGGEINCLDPGGFGAVTITKSMTISCPYTEGGVLAGGNGIVVNDSGTATPGTAVVYLRGLDIFGVNPPTNGVRFVSGAALHIEDSVIRRFNAVNSLGVSFAPATAGAELYITNTTIAENGNGNTGGGIEVAPAVGGSARVTLRNVRVRNNGQDGVRTNSANGFVSMVIEDSEFSGNVQGIIILGGANANIAMINNSSIVNNSVVGIASTNNAITRVDNSTITGNARGVNAIAPSSIFSYGGNRLDGNPTVGAANNGTFTGAIIPRQ